ncbi:MAG: hypothetical protein NG740_05170 [Omnitrophica bacterium]|nr:hypothetical protein [Candidatus Omnitrophota bacterium]
MSDKLNDIEHTFHISRGEIKKFMRDFHSEMERGLRGLSSSLAMLPTYAGRPKGTERGNFLAIDLGGTNLRIAAARLKGRRKMGSYVSDKFVLEKKHITNTGKALFDFIASCTRDFMARHKINLKEKHNIGFTFSFPVRKKRISEGILVGWTKGFSARGVKGKNVVRLLNRSLEKYIPRTSAIAITNDTVSTLVAKSYEDPCSDVGVILGTGTNACYYEKISNIEKLQTSGISSGEMIVNIEWGNFNGFKRTRFDRALDRASENPGRQFLEKMVSGLYIGNLAGLILADFWNCIKPKDFKAEYISEIESDTQKNLPGVNRVLRRFGVQDLGLSERKMVKKICAMVSVRAARLAAAAIASVVTKMDPALAKKHTIAIDGSVYEKHPGFSKLVKLTLKEIFGERAANITLKLTKDASCKGAAIVAATLSREER